MTDCGINNPEPTWNMHTSTVGKLLGVNDGCVKDGVEHQWMPGIESGKKYEVCSRCGDRRFLTSEDPFNPAGQDRS